MTPPGKTDLSEVRGLLRSARQASLGNLVGPLAHQLNSPLTTIMVCSESLAREAVPGSEQREDAEEIHRAALRCREMVQAALRTARRPPSEQARAVDLDQLLRETQQLVAHRMLVAGVTLTLEVDEPLPFALAGPAQVEQVLLHLLENALHACERGATITVGCRTVDDGQALELSVADTGCGMTEQQLARAGQPFYSGWPDGGAGLGLACSLLLARDLGGSLSLDARVERGTRARLRLPVAR